MKERCWRDLLDCIILRDVHALKEALVDMLSSHKLNISMLRGQGYDGASNMRGEFNGLQKKIMDENPHAFYVHCFAH